jgi:hypothetical protein
LAAVAIGPSSSALPAAQERDDTVGEIREYPLNARLE